MTMRRLSIATVSLSAMAVIPWGGAGAQITTVPSLTATVGGSYSTNPFLGDDQPGAGSTQVDIRPSLLLIDGVNQATISGNYNRSDYFSRYGSNDGYGIGVNAGTQLNPRASLGLSASYDSSILGNNGGFNIPNVSTITTPTAGITTGTTVTTPVATAPILTTPVVVGPDLTGVNGDVGLIGLRQRRNQLSAQLNGSYALSSRSSANLGIFGSRATYPGGNVVPGSNSLVSNNKSYGANFGYSRTLSEVSSGGFQISASKVDYSRGLSSQIYTPRLTYSRTLSEIWSFNAAVGAGIVKDSLNGTSTSLSVEGSVCRQGERGSGCLSVSRVPGATGLGGVTVQNQVSLSYSQRLSEVLNIGVNGSYNHTNNGIVSTGTSLLNAGSQDLFSSDVSLSRALGRRLSAVGSVGYRYVNGVYASGSDLSARLGLSVSIGGR
ncbi:hypothetical protein [Sphingomonas sp. Leaf339]|uniref:hypothetical protein n=1 Tax=Sphingomonas sp. Leaf339 TaxID=1736343 RepID=UPI0012E381D5|nr:hypothetical protein [Sphingomonas sp. Leaf339]